MTTAKVSFVGGLCLFTHISEQNITFTLSDSSWVIFQLDEYFNPDYISQHWKILKIPITKLRSSGLLHYTV
jgi:hypothetical protein